MPLSIVPGKPGYFASCFSPQLAQTDLCAMLRVDSKTFRAKLVKFGLKTREGGGEP